MNTPPEAANGAGSPGTDTAELRSPQTDTPPVESTGKPGVEQLQADIEQTRQELGQTVDALSAKLDVKSRTKERMGIAREHAAHGVAEARQRTTDLAMSARRAAAHASGSKYAPAVPVAVAVVAVALVAWRLRHR